MKELPTDRKETHAAQSTASEAARQTLFDDFREDAARYHDWAPDTISTHFIYLNRFLDWLHFDDDQLQILRDLLQSVRLVQMP